MKVNLEKTINTLDGQPFRISESEVLTVRTAFTNAILAENPDEGKLPSAEKLKRFALANKIYSCPEEEIDLSVEELSYINDLCCVFYHIVVAGRINQVINGD